MTKAELEAEIAKCIRSRAWYRGQYERLRESEELQASEIELLQERCISYEREIGRANLQQTREERQADKNRKLRQIELEQRQAEARKRAQSASEEPDEEDEARLFRCQRENTRLRMKVDGLERELAALRGGAG